MLKSIRRALTLIVITLMSITASTAFAEPLKVVASFSIIGDFAKNVGGDRVAVTTLVGPDGDAHVYEPSPADAVSMASAKVVLVNGLHFEGFLQRLVEASASKAAIVELTRASRRSSSSRNSPRPRAPKAVTATKATTTAPPIHTLSSRFPTPRST